jgi:hypothetical protein
MLLRQGTLGEGMPGQTEEEDIAVLNVLPTFPIVPSAPTGSIETEEVVADDNRTQLNVTFPELDPFYFYEVSLIRACFRCYPRINQSINQSV